MKIAITGASGFIGSNLVRELKSESHDIVLLGRNILYNKNELEKKISGADAVFHLAGAPILQRWTTKARTEIMKSRTETTENLVDAINKLPESQRPRVFISASAVGIYQTNEKHTEKGTSFADDFVGEVVRNWERSSESLDKSVRRVVFRIGIVLGSDAKIIRQLLPLFRLGLGGKIASGKQYFPFVHISDIVNAFKWAIGNNETRGIYNLVAPQQITNADFTNTLANQLNRPAWFTVPSIALKLIFGNASALILENPGVNPERLLKNGFQFQFPDIQSCLSEIIKKPH